MLRRSVNCCLLAVLLAIALPAFAGDHAAQYQVGIFSSTGQLSDGSFAYCQGHGCSAYSAGHNIHYVRTADELFAIQAPVSVGRTLLVGMLTDGMAPQIHKEWFMDQLHSDDKVLFAAKCDKHNNCEFWLPDPDRPGKEFITFGYYRADVAKTNTQSLCGKGKLSPAVEAQVCVVASAVPVPPPAPVPVAAPARVVSAGVPAPTRDTPVTNSASMLSPALGSTLAGPTTTFTWTSTAGISSLWLGIAGIGSHDLFNSGEKKAPSVTVTGLPMNGETVYARLWTDFNGTFVYTDYIYKAATNTN